MSLSKRNQDNHVMYSKQCTCQDAGNLHDSAGDDPALGVENHRCVVFVACFP